MLTYIENKRLSVWRFWRHWWHRKLSLTEEINEQSYQIGNCFQRSRLIETVGPHRMPTTRLTESQTRLASYRLFIKCSHYNDVILSAMASQITSLTIVYSNVYSGADQRKHQSSASLASVRGIHRWPANSTHKEPVTRKMFLLDDVFMEGFHMFTVHFCSSDIWKLPTLTHRHLHDTYRSCCVCYYRKLIGIRRYFAHN